MCRRVGGPCFCQYSPARVHYGQLIRVNQHSSMVCYVCFLHSIKTQSGDYKTMCDIWVVSLATEKTTPSVHERSTTNTRARARVCVCVLSSPQSHLFHLNGVPLSSGVSYFLVSFCQRVTSRTDNRRTTLLILSLRIVLSPFRIDVFPSSSFSCPWFSLSLSFTLSPLAFICAVIMKHAQTQTHTETHTKNTYKILFRFNK